MNQHLTGGWDASARIERNGVATNIDSGGRGEIEEIRRGDGLVIIVDSRALERECLARGLLEHNPTLSIAAVGSLDEFTKMANKADISAILVILGSRKATDPSVRAELNQFVSKGEGIPVIIIAHSDGPAEILAALESGAQGYIPTSVKLRVAAEAIGLAQAGGIFVPANAILALRELIYNSANSLSSLRTLFTKQEAAVAGSLRKGKANKIIAYDLNLCREHREGAYPQHNEEAEGYQSHGGRIQAQGAGLKKGPRLTADHDDLECPQTPCRFLRQPLAATPVAGTVRGNARADRG